MSQSPTPDDAPPVTGTVPAAPARARRHWPGALAWLGQWLPATALALLLTAPLAVWLWSGTAGSLAQTLDWASRWTQSRSDSLGRLQVDGVRGSLRSGGRIDHLRWTRDGLDVRIEQLRLELGSAFWTGLVLGRGAQVQSLAIAKLHVDDQRPPSPAASPLQSLTLPLRLSLPWSVDQLRVSGRQTLQANGLQGHYRYGRADADGAPTLPPGTAEAHRLTLDVQQLAQGRYHLQAALGAQAPMPLALQLQGEVRTEVPGGQGTVALQATAQASGTLAGTSATLDLQARARSTDRKAAPALSAQARLMPWATQPLRTVQAQASDLDLSAFWPAAPQTLLSGRVDAAPEGSTWRARVDLANARPGPWDLHRLPLDRLQGVIEQTGSQWQVRELLARIGPGRVQGQGQIGWSAGQAPRWQGELQARQLDPARLWSTFTPLALDASLSAQSTRSTAVGSPTLSPDAIALDASVTPSQPGGAARGGPRALLRQARLKGMWQSAAAGAGRLTLDTLSLDALDLRLDARGRLDLDRRQWEGPLTLQAPGLDARLEGQLGPVAGGGQLQLQVSAADRLLAWLRGLGSVPVLGPHAQAALRPLDHWILAGNAELRADWQGGLAAAGWSPTAGSPPPRPLMIDASLTVPAWRAEPVGGSGDPWTVRDLRLQASGPFERLALQLQGQGAQAPWRLQVDARGHLEQRMPDPLTAGRLALQALSLRLDDDRDGARARSWTLDGETPLAVAWRREGDHLSLDSPAGRLALRPLWREAAAGNPPPRGPLQIEWSHLRWQAGALESRGRLRGLPLSWLDTLASPGASGNSPMRQAGLGGDLVFEADWDLALPADPAQALRLSAQLQRSGGDLTVQTDQLTSASPPGAGTTAAAAVVNAGVQEARLQVGAQGRSVQASLRWRSERLGQASAELQTQLASGQGPADAGLLARWWPESMPLSGSLRAELPQVGVWSALAPPGWRMRGTLRAEAALTGSRASPQWSGSLQADELALVSRVDGFALTRGQLRATLAGDRIRIEQLSLQGPRGAESGGRLDASGSAEWRPVGPDGQRRPFIELQATADRLRVSTRADRRLTLSGQLTAQLASERLQVRGRLRADEALFILPDELTPSLGSDVVMRGGRHAPLDPNARRVEPDVSIDLDLGQRFEVKGRGLQARLAGQLNLRSTAAVPTPRVLGEVRTESGSYRAYGQQLSIETGVLRFVGPYDDPTLNIVAIRPQGSSDQRVGVQIAGTAQSPRVRLFSDPDMPDSDKLAWLVLGRPATGAGAEAAVLQQAALALLSGGGEGPGINLAKAVGLDELALRGESTNTDGSTNAAALTLGKRLSNELYLSYERTLAGTMGTVSVFYDLSRRFTLRARAGEENAIDLIFTLRYD